MPDGGTKSKRHIDIQSLWRRRILTTCGQWDHNRPFEWCFQTGARLEESFRLRLVTMRETSDPHAEPTDPIQKKDPIDKKDSSDPNQRKGGWLKRNFDETPQIAEDTISGYLLKASISKFNVIQWNHRWVQLNINQGTLCYWKKKPSKAADDKCALTPSRVLMYQGISNSRRSSLTLLPHC